jgi:hypothetical protein
MWREVRRLLGVIPLEESDKGYRAYQKLLEQEAMEEAADYADLPRQLAGLLSKL